MNEFRIIIHSLEEAAWFVDQLEKENIHGRLYDKKHSTDARSLMGIIYNDLIGKPITFQVEDRYYKPEQIIYKMAQ